MPVTDVDVWSDMPGNWGGDVTWTVDVAGFAQVQVTDSELAVYQERYAARVGLPLWHRVVQEGARAEWLAEHVAPFVWLSMPCHDLPEVATWTCVAPGCLAPVDEPVNLAYCSRHFAAAGARAARMLKERHRP